MIIDELVRAVEADPHDEESARRLLATRARIDGSGLLSDLDDRVRWKNTPKAFQDAALLEVARRLGDGWEFTETRVFECPNTAPCGNCNGSGEVAVSFHYMEFCTTCEGSGKSRVDIVYSHRLGVFHHKRSWVNFVLVPGGNVEDNDPTEVPWVEMTPDQRHEWEAQRRKVLVKVAPLLVARWPVTVGQWLRSSSTIPMTMVNHCVTNEWCIKRGFRLPSSSEWNYAFRAGTHTRFPWGDHLDSSYCWHRHNSLCESRESGPGVVSPTHHDANEKWNPFGLVDMAGNVWEWMNSLHVAGGCYLTRRDNFANTGAPPAGIEPSNPAGLGRPYIGFRPVVDIPHG